MDYLSSQRRTEKQERHASQERKGRRSALSASERLSDSTEHHQAGVHRNPIRRRPDSESSLRWELLAALADVHSDQIHSHPDSEFCGGRALAAAVALRSREILAEAPDALFTEGSMRESKPNSAGSKDNGIIRVVGTDQEWIGHRPGGP